MSGQTIQEPSVDSFGLHAEGTSVLNYAMQQNDVPVLRKVVLYNRSREDPSSLTLVIRTEPIVTQELSLKLEPPGMGASVEIGPDRIDPVVLPDAMAGREERTRGLLFLELYEGSEDEPLNTQSYPIDFLAYNEWQGTDPVPELLAAFVMPNHPVVEEVVRQAAEILRQQTGDGSLHAYSSTDNHRLFTEIRALYEAVAKQGITYVNPPPSFERTGQKIRTPDQVANYRYGTCLDLTVFFAAVAEQAGLRPVIVLAQGHSFVSVWLTADSFSSPVVSAPLGIKKRVDLGEQLVIETTGLTASPPAPFEQAAKRGYRHFDSPAYVRLGVDVYMARQTDVRPLPSRCPEGAPSVDLEQSPSQSVPPADETSTSPEDDLASVVPPPQPEEEPDATAGEVEEQDLPRLERWKRKLLDLSRRNRLLNFKQTKKTLPLLCHDLAVIEDSLSEGKKFTILSRPSFLEPSDPRSTQEFKEKLNEDRTQEFLRGQLEQGRLHTALSDKDLEKNLLEISRADRLSREESGANTLFLALGFLRWYDPNSRYSENRAPIILIPMELERVSMKEGFRISRMDDEARVNETLLEKLRNDFGVEVPGMDPPPGDESGLDVRGILSQFRRAVKNWDRWDVEEDAHLAILTFTKFLMWLDLEKNTDILKQNRLVQHLIENPGEPFADDGDLPPIPKPEELDEALPPAQEYCPLETDSSQLAAVLAAERGHSFVLQGPPGTGKSQTISNLICHCMSRGKRVLFVSEKMAALRMVQKNLESVHLAPYCLELHSRKATKRAFREQLDQALQLTPNQQHNQWEEQTTTLKELRDAVNGVVHTLHAQRPHGQTAHWTINRLIQHEELPTINPEPGEPEQITSDKMEEVLTTAGTLQRAGETAGVRSDHPLLDVRLREWSPSVEETVKEAIQAVDSAAVEFEDAAREALPYLHLGGSEWPRFVLDFGVEMAALLMDAPPVSRDLLLRGDAQQVQTQFRALISSMQQKTQAEEELGEQYTDDLYDLPLDMLRERLQNRKHAGWLVSLCIGGRIRGQLKHVRKHRKARSWETLEKDIETAQSVVRLRNEIEGMSDFTSQLADCWSGEDATHEELTSVFDWLCRFHHQLSRVAFETAEEEQDFRELVADFVTERRNELVENGSVGSVFRRLRQSAATFNEHWQHLQTVLSLDSEAAVCDSEAPDFLGRVREACRRWSDNVHQLRPWSAYQKARADATGKGLQPVIESAENGDFSWTSLPSVVEKSLAHWYLEYLFQSDSGLSSFFGHEHNRRISDFQSVDSKVRDLTKHTVCAQLSQQLPRVDQASERYASSEISKLKRFARTGRLTIRRVFKECPEALSRLKPCVLMSPLSVAQFLGPDFPPFDLVVFDEASQMPPWEAIGAIARADQAVVVGDSKQLPPTTFFERSADEEPSEDEFQDMESILDECIACNFPTLTLRWHYRSKHESLIAFSNSHYYQNSLLTFPSALHEEDHLGIVWREVPNGCYDAGKSRTNREEAQALVDEIVKRLSSEERSGDSLGVVTFSTSQQRLIEDLLEEARREHPEIDPFFTDAVAEPVFVKNLETVQGDERDVIMFSICYGPNKNGTVNHYFGPLNTQGGERRLNVAITRARAQLVVFSTLDPDQIELSRTNSAGAEHLKSFLEFARNGGTDYSQSVFPGAEGDFESPLEESVYNTLSQRGWRLDTQVGCSGYRIDLAVKDPERPGRYILGIECDGANYHSAKTARDRDKLRQKVLEGLGWRLTRIWSTDWWLERDKVVERIEQDLDESLTETGEIHGGRDSSANQPVSQKKSKSEIDAQVEDIDRTESSKESACEVTQAAADAEQPPDDNAAIFSDSRRRVYQAAVCSEGENRDTEKFYSDAGGRIIRRDIETVLNQEAPVHEELLIRRIAEFWGFGRVTNRVRERVRSLLPGSYPQRKTETGVFIFLQNEHCQNSPFFRIPEDDDSRRYPDHICPQEVATAMEMVLEQHLSLHREDLLRATAEMFGFNRLGNRVRRKMEEGLTWFLGEERGREEGEKVVLNQKGSSG